MITGTKYKDMIIEAAKVLQSKKTIANDLNVFPVPDGDTGTNMSMTMNAAMREMMKTTQPDLALACDGTSSSLLRGARGNSGVILSLLFRGIGSVLKHYTEAGGFVLAQAFKTGVETAYKAVMKPAEGTILTVSRVSADAAIELAKSNENISVEEILDEVINVANIALVQTQFQNPVLEKAGVVDAGGYGYIAILEGMRDAFLGNFKEYIDVPSMETEKFISEEEINFTYCTEFIAERVDKHRNITRFKSMLEGIGDSIVVVDDDDIVKVHLHTDQPDKVITQGLKFGPLITVKIENMREQHSEVVINNSKKNPISKEKTTEKPTEKPAEITKKYGFVAVASGNGLVNLFKDLGVDYVTLGGQTMNPSTDDLLKAIYSVPSEIVYILPNNKNIVMAAQQTIDLCDKKVIVLPTHTIPQGITAMLGFDENSNETDNTKNMTEAFNNVSSGLVTYAARDSEFDGKVIKQGEFLSLSENKLIGNSKKLETTIESLVKNMIKPEVEFITIITGADATEKNNAKVINIFKKAAPNAEFTIIDGGQPVYYYIISAE